MRSGEGARKGRPYVPALASSLRGIRLAVEPASGRAASRRARRGADPPQAV